jgi:phage/plasmid primase-like uncharacterized protein
MDTALHTQFLDFARLHDVHIDPQRLQADGRIHRADVGDRPNGRNDAAYLLREDGTGWVTNFKAEGKPIAFRPELARERTPEEIQKAQAERAAWQAQQVERQKAAINDSLARWEASHEPVRFPYLQNPALPTAGLRQHSAQLLVPMLSLTDGEPGWVGMQRIAWAEPGQSPDKRFVAGTPTRGAFAVIPIDGHDAEAPLRAYEAAKTAPHVVMCEGIGTALAIHQATGLPVIAALSAQNLPEVARSLHDQLQGRITLYADNDGERAAHKGQVYAIKAARILGSRAGIALPEKPGGVTPPGYDARDQLRDGGVEAIRNTMGRLLRAQQVEQRLPPGALAPRSTPEKQKTLLSRDGPITRRADERGSLGRRPEASGPILVTSRRDSNNPNHQEFIMAEAKDNKELTTGSAQPAFAELNAALEQTEASAVPPEAIRSAQKEPVAQAGQDVGDTRDRETQLLDAWREAAQPAREARAKAWQDLNAQHQAAREALFASIAQQRAEAVNKGQDPDLQAFEAARQIEHLQKQQAAERKTLASGLPVIPSLRDFLQAQAEHDPVAARMLEEEKARDPAQESIRGKRTAALEPEVLDGLTHDIEDGPPKVVHYARDGERVMSDRGERVDLYQLDDREIEAALRLAEQKFDMDKGLLLTGSREFQERAAELAGRLGMKVQNPELQAAWRAGRIQAMQQDELAQDVRLTAPAVGKGSIEAAREGHSGGRDYAVDAQTMQAEALLSKMDVAGWDALDRASRHQPLSPEQRAQLQGHDEQTRLIDEKDRLTPLGERVSERMWGKIEEERAQLQQQLRTRNIDEELKKEQDQEKAKEQAQEKSQEKTVERQIEAQDRAEERQIEAQQREPVRARPRQVSRDMGLGR